MITTKVLVNDLIDNLENRDWSGAQVKNYFEHNIDAAIAAAVAEERERCAKVAESINQHYIDDNGNKHTSTVTGMKKRTAAAIRNGSK